MQESLSVATARQSDRASDSLHHLSQILAPLSQALDLVEGQPLGHSIRTAAIGMRIAEQAGLDDVERGHLFYALLLKDAGTSANASELFHSLRSDEIRIRPDLRTTGWPQSCREGLTLAIASTADGTPLFDRIGTMLRLGLTEKIDSERLIRMRGEYGAAVARKLKLAEPVAQAILNSEERWDGGGLPRRLRHEEIPVGGRIIALAQTLEVLRNKPNADQAMDFVDDHSGTWFDPELVRVAKSLHQSGGLFADLDDQALAANTLALEPTATRILMTETSVDTVCSTFAWVIDAKSPYTLQRSRGVATLAESMGRYFGFSESDLRFLRRGALLHDLGMLAVPNVILEKPAELTNQEFAVIRHHPQVTLNILSGIPSFGDISQLAASHHEALDGSGYLRGIGAKELSFPARILAVADTFHALHSKRPYRKAFDTEQVLQILDKDVPSRLDPHCVEAVRGLALAEGTNQDTNLFTLLESVEGA